MLYPATCVGLRYGPRPARTPRVDFSREYATVRLSLRPKPPRTVGSRLAATSLQRAVPSARASFAPPSSTGLTGRGQRNLHRLSIAYASRLPLRSRLTLIRLALIRNPWPSGEGGFPPPLSLLMPAFAFPRPPAGLAARLRRRRNAPLPIHLFDGFHVFGTGLMPDYYPRGTARLVSCYALFE